MFSDDVDRLVPSVAREAAQRLGLSNSRPRWLEREDGPAVECASAPIAAGLSGDALATSLTRAAVPAYTDTELFEGIADGDERIARELYRRVLPGLEATLYRVLGRREHDHEDLVQSGFAQVVASIAQRRRARACTLNTWASTIAAHIALKSLRSRYRHQTRFDARFGDGAPADLRTGRDDVGRTVCDRREIEFFRARLSELPEAQAEVLILHDLMRHPLTEVASITGVSVTAAQSRLLRSRKELMLRLSLARDDEGRRSDAGMYSCDFLGGYVVPESEDAVAQWPR